MLSSHQRVFRALCIEEPDRVPIFEPWGLSGPTADIVLDRQCIAWDPLLTTRMLAAGKLKAIRTALVKDNYEIVKKLDFDAGMIILLPTKNDSKPEMLGENRWIEKQIAGTSYVWAEGESIFKMSEDTQIPVAVDSIILREGISGFEKYVRKLEEVSAEEYEEKMAPRFHDYDQMLGRLWRKLDVMIHTGIEGTATPHGGGWYPTYLKCFYLRPDIMKRYLSQHVKKMLRFVGLAMDFGAELIYTGGDIAHNQGPMLSPKHYREFLLPIMKKLSSYVHRRGGFISISSDGNLWPIIDDYLINSKMDGMMEIQESAGMDIEKLKSLYGDRICFTGSVDSQTILVHDSPAEVKKETKRVMSILSPGGGHILSSSNSVYPGVKPENAFAMYETARKYGQYSGKTIS